MIVDFLIAIIFGAVGYYIGQLRVHIEWDDWILEVADRKEQDEFHTADS